MRIDVLPVAAGRVLFRTNQPYGVAGLGAAALGVLGHSVEVAHDGQSALGLPDMDGFQLAAAVRGLGFGGIPVAFTGYGQESDKRRALAAGFDQHLTQPIGLDELEEALAARRKN